MCVGGGGECAGGECLVVMEIGTPKERPDLHWNKGKVPLEPDPTCGRKLSMKFLLLERNNEQEFLPMSLKGPGIHLELPAERDIVICMILTLES